MDIILLRHGETVDNIKKVYSRDNTWLTDKGKAEIIAAKESLEELHYEDVYCSPFARTIETMELLSLEGMMESRIQEMDFGIFKGSTFKEISKLYPKETSQWIEDPINYRIPEGENVLDVYARIEGFLEELIKKDRNALLICHDGVIRSILSWIFDQPEYLFRFRVDNGSITIITIDADYKYIKKLNN